ncbi:MULTISPECIES: DUF805 domain-containing protein [Moraxella]|uniref:DUF805 domain-containing protein n=1 Tax=Moraxella TaxID=475 RepID=UPI001560260C|nr:MULTISPECIES: DUF805 domain-containing protein [Moraxella]MBE9579603.1 DUF805 domain-containing protein [Moraxella sp. K1664]MBE9588948.1 DUF805 domain-containing protein [Moraxella sp. K1630]MBE9591328.1 DUF805 domain-containing protein [Moraxella sp. K127]MBE9597203.1 DUF805 domain-containing protein [Moraxella sp. K2450]MDH9219712.1 DUF805 domain-containing protein [Moraxella lacunata]
MAKILLNYFFYALTIRLFDFKGRTARRGWFVYASLLGAIVIGRLISSLKTDSVLIFSFNIFIVIVCLIAYFSVTVRRLHDANFSSWLLLGCIFFPPLLFLTYFSGTKGDNKYGQDPRENEFGYLL